jgi:hypothetical protein
VRVQEPPLKGQLILRLGGKTEIQNLLPATVKTPKEGVLRMA